MKAVSLINTYNDNQSNHKIYITIGKTYDVVDTNDIEGKYYTILGDDKGGLCIFPKNWFVLLEDERDRKLKQLLDES